VNSIKNISAIGLAIYAFLCVHQTGNALAATYKEAKTLSLQKDLNLTQDWKATVYIEDSEEYFPKLPVKLCFWYDNTDSHRQCEIATGEDRFNAIEIIDFHPTKDPRKGILFHTYTWDGGGGHSWIKLWTYDDNKHKFNNILPKGIRISAQGSHKFINSFGKEKDRIYVLADYIWFMGTGVEDPNREARWDHHRYKISIYKYVSEKKGMSL